ncbi:spermidine synthase [Pseudorhizobium tarimense]|uniref:Spermidine synthase n=1 Tax=Pseudorhizobium tarimense TaxID=1079109 RepID=A0ABV2HCR9_9HYPH|nr:hypothetical protein [Pseudorhizobium tarimense]MCJ8521401.1 hypothetical protein [Pseudorhizobium tarimense]
MIPWTLIDTAKVPGGNDELRLKQRGTEFSIMLGTNELMNSRLSGSEEALAHLSIDKIRDRPRPKVLIGGLGMGFTLRAALAELPEGAEVVVAELVSAVIRWARNEMAEVFNGCLDDPRVTIVEADVGELIRREKASYDAILLDVDNGPEALTREENDRIYDARGLGAAKAALRPSGVLSFWSSTPESRFTRQLRSAGFTVEEVPTRASTKGRGAKHMIWVAVKPGR